MLAGRKGGRRPLALKLDSRPPSPHWCFPVRCWRREMTPVLNPPESGVRSSGCGAAAPRLARERPGASGSSARTAAPLEGLASAPSGWRPRRKCLGVFDLESVPRRGKGAHRHTPRPRPPREPGPGAPRPARAAAHSRAARPPPPPGTPQHTRHTYAPPGSQTPRWPGGRAPRPAFTLPELAHGQGVGGLERIFFFSHFSSRPHPRPPLAVPRPLHIYPTHTHTRTHTHTHTRRAQTRSLPPARSTTRPPAAHAAGPGSPRPAAAERSRAGLRAAHGESAGRDGD